MVRAEDKLEPDSILEYFARIPDPRKARRRAHPLENILIIALLAVLCGADSFVAMELFGKAKRDLLKTVLDLKAGIPSHDTFGRVFAALRPEALGEAFCIASSSRPFARSRRRQVRASVRATSRLKTRDTVARSGVDAGRHPTCRASRTVSVGQAWARSY
jgi:DDE_Tnp_1-associated